MIAVNISTISSIIQALYVHSACAHIRMYLLVPYVQLTLKSKVIVSIEMTALRA